MATTATSLGADAGGFLGGLLNPVLGGTTSTTVTQKPSASSTTITIIGITVVVVIIAIVGYITFKKKAS